MNHFTSRGGKALIRLGIISTIIAIATTGLSLYFYHASGDIYIDRSRPGFLPEKHEKEIEEYLENIRPIINTINETKKPFSKDSLSDKSLGISN